MHLVQILLPLHDNAGQPFPPTLHAELREELTERFQGLTAYARAPATGLWKDDPARVRRDELVVYEVMTPDLDAGWWRGFRSRCEARLGQDVIVVRVLPMDLI